MAGSKPDLSHPPHAVTHKLASKEYTLDSSDDTFELVWVPSFMLVSWMGKVNAEADHQYF